MIDRDIETAVSGRKHQLLALDSSRLDTFRHQIYFRLQGFDRTAMFVLGAVGATFGTAPWCLGIRAQWQAAVTLWGSAAFPRPGGFSSPAAGPSFAGRARRNKTRRELREMWLRPLRICLIATGIISFAPIAFSATAQATTDTNSFLEITTLPLWEGQVPGSTGTDEGDVPTLSVFRPEHHHGNGTAVIIAPGGAYIGLSGNLEGRQLADWFAARGVTAFVLKYRLAPRYRHPIQLQDAQRAIRFVRSHASTYGIARNRIGMIGFSAGGHLAAMAATHFDNGNPDAADPTERQGSRPDFIIVGYPTISFENLPPQIRNDLAPFLGPNPSKALLDELSADRHVTAQTPPAFIYATTDDELVPVEQSIIFYQALHAAGVPVEMHLFAHGAHGSGLGAGDAALDLWSVALENWLRAKGLFSIAPEAMAAVHTSGPLSVDATVGELLTDSAAHAVLLQELPQLVSSPQIEQARDLSLRSLQRYVPQLLTPAKLGDLDARLRAVTADRK